MDELWNRFLLSGSVEDYLNYKQQRVQEDSDANDGQGTDYPGTDNGRE